MFNTKKIFTILMGCLLSANLVLAAALMPNTPAVCNNVSTWLKPGGDKVLATPAQIQGMNKAMLSTTMSDLAKQPATMSGNTLKGYLNAYTMEYDQYINGSRMSEGFAKSLLADAYGNIPPSAPVKYGVVVSRSDLRSFPTLARAFDSPGDTKFDNWQETAVDPGSPALILHKNTKGNFVFVQLPSYRGWLPANKVAVTDRKTWLEFAEPKEFGVVTDKLLTVSGAGPTYWLYQMGSKIPVTAKGRLLLPLRNAKGYLNPVEMPAPWGDKLHKGYLPYTENNLVKMAFKHLGAPYGWGGMFNSVDCSAYIQDIYATMGVHLPRNGDEQADAYNGTNLKGLSWQERDNIIKKMPTGTILFTPYHVMLYLGLYKGRPYMIHSTGSYGAKTADGSIYKNPIMQVVVSDLYLLGGSGNPLLMQMTEACDYR